MEIIKLNKLLEESIECQTDPKKLKEISNAWKHAFYVNLNDLAKSDIEPSALDNLINKFHKNVLLFDNYSRQLCIEELKQVTLSWKTAFEAISIESSKHKRISDDDFESLAKKIMYIGTLKEFLRGKDTKTID